ncbi:hypothetical protein JXQ70_03455 [bacterium]|nr:hypothetical protein [bacterium]
MDAIVQGFINLKNQRLQECAEHFTFCLSFNKIPIYQQILLQHILGLMYYYIGNVKLGKKFLFQAVKLEKQIGLNEASLHTSHQASLLEHVQGNLQRANEYYYSTLAHMKKSHELQAMTLCLRTLGEFALMSGNIERATMFWEKGLVVADKATLPPEILTQEWLNFFRTTFQTQ